MPGRGQLRANACLSPLQTGEYATDEEEEMSPMFPSGEMAIEVFELAENEDTLSPVEMDPEKLVHKFKEVRGEQGVPGDTGRRDVAQGRACPVRTPGSSRSSRSSTPSPRPRSSS